MRWLVAGISAVAIHAAILGVAVSPRRVAERRVPMEVVAQRPPEPQPEPQPEPEPQPQPQPQPEPQPRPRKILRAPVPVETAAEPEKPAEPSLPAETDGTAGPVPGGGDGTAAGGEGAVALPSGKGGFGRRLVGSFGAPLPDCPESARRVYVVDRAARLVRFEPGAERPFQVVGRLRCPAAESSIENWREAPHPYSMSVDRHGRAWVLYSSGELFVVSTTDAGCRRAAWEPGRGGYELFGMGFARLGGREQLFVAGGSLAELERGEGKIGIIDTATLAADTVGRHRRGDHSPELAGAAEALYAFYPGESVARVDPRTAETRELWRLGALPSEGKPRTWAFAPFGGRFYLFVGEEWSGRKNRVYVLEPGGGGARLLYDNTPHDVTGAGVSTCATPP